jgi:hypothetical protein
MSLAQRRAKKDAYVTRTGRQALRYHLNEEQQFFTKSPLAKHVCNTIDHRAVITCHAYSMRMSEKNFPSERIEFPKLKKLTIQSTLDIMWTNYGCE